MTTEIRIDGLANARDLGGLTRQDGSTTPSGVFLRSESLGHVSRSGWQTIRASGVRTVIDLRRPSERSTDVPADLVYRCVDLDGADETEFWTEYEADGRWATPLYYSAHLHALTHRTADVLRTIADAPPGAILFHCSAGWDRTGLVAALLLRALDTSVDDAVADYMRSFENAPRMERLHGRSFEANARRRVLEAHGHTAESAFLEAYENLDLSAWFDMSGIDTGTRDAIWTWRGAVPPPREN
ncbi:tyrosine-protein phosphatase [Microbacterium hydrocarbonoxydans]|uniref:Protein tyrosine/serine phosphatase n=1 Tax=Microbacterium hydrocarbonoxydans TaxID=273678 RepID=A0A1H4M6L2_9MICO|nr:tyrosine-protein phosphatase [Microbacterium hydrocarbonoxydans]SEB78583.1 Protein tyrosine/serine phosphatase [Microbacterium hydrocarbonoxydans]